MKENPKPLMPKAIRCNCPVCGHRIHNIEVEVLVLFKVLEDGTVKGLPPENVSRRLRCHVCGYKSPRRRTRFSIKYIIKSANATLRTLRQREHHRKEQLKEEIENEQRQGIKAKDIPF